MNTAAQTPITTGQAIVRLLRFSPKLYALSFALNIFRTCIILVPGLLIQAIFNTLTPSTQSTQLSWWVWALIALLVVSALGRVAILLTAVAVESVAFYNSGALLRKNLFDYLLSRPGAQALPFSVGEVINRLNWDVGDGVAGYLRSLLLMLGQAVQALIAAAILFILSPLYALITLAPIFAAGILINVFSPRIQKYRQASRRADGNISALLGEIFGSVQAIQVATAEEQVIDHFRVLSEERRKTALKDRLFNEIITHILGNNMANVGTGILLLLIGQAMRVGSFSVGDFALFVYLLVWVNDFTSWFGVMLAAYKQVGVSFERLTAILRETTPKKLLEYQPTYMRGALPELSTPTQTSEHHLEMLTATGLTYHYPDAARGIEDVSLSIKKGSFTVITGRIGAGKTTLLRVLLGLLPRESGTITWNGALVDDPASFFVPPCTSYTPQVPRLFSESLKENILMGLANNDGDKCLLQAIHSAVMEQDVAHLEEGMDTIIGPRGVKLSGGQAQRTAAARMFVRNPALYVFDDLSSALDVETEHVLWERLSMQTNATYLVVSHRRAALRHANTILVLKDGKIEDMGTLNELLARSQEMQRIWHSEM
jgi:ATP-binding cassette subfamily B protein